MEMVFLAILFSKEAKDTNFQNDAWNNSITAFILENFSLFKLFFMPDIWSLIISYKLSEIWRTCKELKIISGCSAGPKTAAANKMELDVTSY